jgi:putative endonuclease
LATKPQCSSTQPKQRDGRRTNGRITSHQLGKQAEDYVSAWLQQQGYQLVARNFRCRSGEIDLIVHAQDQLIFVEVKLRRTTGKSDVFASGLESVTPQKQRRISQCAQYFLLCHPRWYDYNIRFDVVALDSLQSAPCWIQSAFDA